MLLLIITFFLESAYEPSSSESEEDHLSSPLGEEDETNSTFQKKIGSKRKFDEDEDEILIKAVNKPITAPDGCKMIVSKSNTAKKFYCIWCNKFLQKFARHLLSCHMDQAIVKKFASIPPGRPERIEIISKIRGEHEFQYNTNNIMNNGELIVKRRPNKKMGPTNDTTNADKIRKHLDCYKGSSYTVCPKCKIFFLRSSIRHHYRKCRESSSTQEPGIKRNLQSKLLLKNRIHELASEKVKSTFFYIRDDEIGSEARYDWLVVEYFNTLVQRYPSEEDEQMLRSKARTIGRFILASKKIDPAIKDLADIMVPSRHKLCMEATYKVSGTSDDYNTIKAPSTALAIGTLIKQIAKFLCRVYIEREDRRRKRATDEFLEMMEGDFTIINCRAKVVHGKNVRLKEEAQLPSKGDIAKLVTYLEAQRTLVLTSLRRKFSYESWIKLSELTLLSIQVFNRRRQGETSKIKVEDYRRYKKFNTSGIDFISLTDKCKVIAQTYARFLIRGKLGSDVPVLLTDDLIECIEAILSFRDLAKVNSANPYLFGLPPTDNNRNRRLVACIVMREVS